MVDMAFAKQQLRLLLDRRYLHPNGQLSAYEWNFSDVNPPVHAWATLPGATLWHEGQFEGRRVRPPVFLAAWSWSGDRGDGRHVVVVNLSGQPAQGRVPLDWPDLPGRSWWLTDILGKEVFERDGAELASPGLFVALEPWQFYVLALR